MELYQELHRHDALTVRMTTAFGVDVGVKHTLSPQELADFEEARKRFTGDRVRAGVIKFFSDGVIETHTAAMLQPYANKPGDSGSTLYTPEQFRKYFLELDKRGFQVMTHSIGDGAVLVPCSMRISTSRRSMARATAGGEWSTSKLSTPRTFPGLPSST